MHDLCMLQPLSSCSALVHDYLLYSLHCCLIIVKTIIKVLAEIYFSTNLIIPLLPTKDFFVHLQEMDGSVSVTLE